MKRVVLQINDADKSHSSLHSQSQVLLRMNHSHLHLTNWSDAEVMENLCSNWTDKRGMRKYQTLCSLRFGSDLVFRQQFTELGFSLFNSSHVLENTWKKKKAIKQITDDDISSFRQVTVWSNFSITDLIVLLKPLLELVEVYTQQNGAVILGSNIYRECLVNKFYKTGRTMWASAYWRIQNTGHNYCAPLFILNEQKFR